MSILKALELLRTAEVFLASGSPRRLDLLQKLGTANISQMSIPESVENLNPESFSSPKEYVLAIVRKKFEHAWSMIPSIKKRFPDLVIAADTVVVDGKEILEKPKSAQDNFRMISQLSGRSHSVITAVMFSVTDSETQDRLVQNQKLSVSDYETLLQKATVFAVETKVTFMHLAEDTISWYVESKEGSDKAGGYGIQGTGASLIESVNGCFYNVVGFPVNRFVVELNARLTNPQHDPLL